MAIKITTRAVEAMEPGDEVYDSEVRGFGVRRQRRDAVYILRKRIRGKARQFSIGIHGSPWTPDTARREARRLLVEIDGGADLAALRAEEKAAPTVSDFCDQYLKDAKAGLVTYRGKPKKTSTLGTDEGRITRHIKPLLGAMKVRDLTRADIERFMRDVASGKTAADEKTGHRGRAIVTGGAGTASRTVSLLGGILSYAVRLGVRPDNPCRGVERFSDGKRNRVLIPEEWKALGEALEIFEAQGGNAKAVAITRLIALTGARRSEIVKLRMKEIDLDKRLLDLEDTKTGRSIRPLGGPARTLLRNLTEKPLHTERLFSDETGEGFYQGYGRCWTKIRTLADLPSDITPHVLRHSFATMAGDLGFSTSTIASLLGHKAANITELYVHRRVDSVLVGAADKVAARIEAMLCGGAEAKVIEFPTGGQGA